MNIVPNMYKKDICLIDYDKLKSIGIKVLLFDFDNTIIEHGNGVLSDKVLNLFEELKDNFLIYVVSNSFNKRKVSSLCKVLDIPYVIRSVKPFKFGYNKIKLKSFKPCEIAAIGDQVLTDVIGGNRMGYYTILTDPISCNEVIFSKFNRRIENFIINKTHKYKRGSYYD